MAGFAQYPPACLDESDFLFVHDSSPKKNSQQMVKIDCGR
jgi:hypothetical protein